MARKQEDSKKSHSPGENGQRRFLRYCGVLLLAGVLGLGWLSMLTFSPTDPPSPDVYPPKNPADNSAGMMGAYLAYFLRYWVGGGVFMGLSFASLAAVIMILGGKIGDVWWRVIGAAILVIATSASAYIFKHTDPSAGLLDWGILGQLTGRFLLGRFALAGGWIILVISMCIGLMLTADNLVLRLPVLGRKVADRCGKLPSIMGGIRQVAGKTSSLLGSGVESVSKPLQVIRRSVSIQPAGEKKVENVFSSDPPAPAVVRSAAVASQTLPEKNTPEVKKTTQPTRQDRRFALPPVGLLAEPSGGYIESQETYAQQRQAVLQQTLENFDVSAEVVGFTTGPVITMFEVSLAPGVKVAKVNTLANDIARALAVPGVRIVSPLPNRDTIGIEVPNHQKEIVRLRELMDLSPDSDSRMHLPLYLGKDASGGPIVADLAGMPHVLLAGTTGSGKSVCINAIIMSLLMTRTPRQARLILVDPKMVEMAAFENLPHLLCPIVNDMRRAEDILEWAASKMDERYEIFKEAGVRNIAGLNRLSADEIYQRLNIQSDEERKAVQLPMPYYIVIIDELADLIMTSTKEVEAHIIRLAQKARAVGIHLILATQRPSANVVTGLIKSNMPCRISFRVSSGQESRIVLDQGGADVLLGQGDMLFLQPGTSNLIRAQGTYVDDQEIRNVVGFVRQSGEPAYNNELVSISAARTGEGSGQRDELFDQAVEIVLASRRGSVSLLQRRLQVGYSRASRIIDQMAEAGLLGEYKGSQARECLMTLDDWYALKESIEADQSGEAAVNSQPTSS